MEISPIPGIRVDAIMKVTPTEPELPAVFDIGRLVESGDDTWSGNDGKAAGGQDDEENQADEFEEKSEEEPPQQLVESNSSEQVNYFA
jgi:hypothetical protein